MPARQTAPRALYGLRAASARIPGGRFPGRFADRRLTRDQGLACATLFLALFRTGRSGGPRPWGAQRQPGPEKVLELSMTPALRFFLAAAVIAVYPALFCARASGAGPQPSTVRLEWKGRLIEGWPLFWDANEARLVGRDGQFFEFHPRQATGVKKVSNSFRPFNSSEMRNALVREFGPLYEIAGTGKYLVVHPTGKGDFWRPRFEELYRSFVHYFTVRGMKLAEPPFPLVAVVFANQGAFMRYAAAEGHVNIGPTTLGFYSLRTNRVYMFDVGGSTNDSQRWFENASTLIHEAAHQTGFNTGLHGRFAQNPVWVLEGLGTLFEAPGVWDSRNRSSQKDRINAGRLADFQAWVAAGRPEGLLGHALSSDVLFQRNPGAAYAEAWALSFFLCETRPRQYCEYLARLGARPPFENYAPQQRLADFKQVFQTDLKLLERQFLDFMAELP